MFVAFYVYEKKEEEIDGLVLSIISIGSRLKSDAERNIGTKTNTKSEWSLTIRYQFDKMKFSLASFPFDYID